MQYGLYQDLHIGGEYSIFEFLSRGKKGIIIKRIAFAPTEYFNVYNLVFGDVDINGDMSDYNISNNGDRNKVLATVAYAIDIYLNKYPERSIFFTGSTLERTRLYRIAVSLNLGYLSRKFEIYCQTENGIVPFHKNINVISFLVRLKP